MQRCSKDILVIVICFCVCLLIVITTFFSIKKNNDTSKTVTISNLNEEYNGKINIIATDIKTIKVFEDNEEHYYVGVRFEVYNNSDITYGIISTQISTYVDDVSQLNMDFARKYFDKNGENLFSGDLAPGKKTMGYQVAEVNANSEKVEFVFDNPDYGDIINFVFDIPEAKEL